MKTFVLWFAMLMAFSIWAFAGDSPWTRALAVSNGPLPEMQWGFPAIEPARSMAALNGATSDYITWQLVDIPYAVMNFMIAYIGISIGLERLKLDHSLLRLLLILPFAYITGEIMENIFLAGYASALIPTSGGAPLIQQAATTTKLTAGSAGMLLGVLGAVAAIIRELIGLATNKK